MYGIPYGVHGEIQYDRVDFFSNPLLKHICMCTVLYSTVPYLPFQYACLSLSLSLSLSVCRSDLYLCQK